MRPLGESSMLKSALIAASIIATAAAVFQAASAGAAVGSDNPAIQLRTLFTASDEAYLKRNPVYALVRGDLRYADQFGDYITDAYFAAEKQAAADDLAALARIDRGSLKPQDRVSYDVFRYQRSDDLKGFGRSLLRTRIERPIDHFFGIQTFVPDMSSGDGVAPFKSVADYDNNLKRLNGYFVYIDRAIGRMKQGLADGITNPKVVMAHVVEQLDALIAEGVEGSTFYRPVKKLTDSIPSTDRTRLTAAYAAFIRDRLLPAHMRLRDFIEKEYLPRARDTVGLGQMPGGPELYRYLVANTTTTDVTPDAIHALGLSEVERIHVEMERVKTTTGFKGSLQEFANFMRTDPRFVPKSPEAMRDAFLSIKKTVVAALPNEFAVIPKSPLEIRPVPAYKEKTEAGGSYLDGSADGSRPGVFYFNTYDLPTRLGPELGMFTDPYQLYGHLNDEILRAMRLVVDTGIHTQGWSRDAAIAYMLDNSTMSRTNATAEVERYIAVPSQALAYKIGQLTIQRLRAKAEKELGPKFDVRAFHAQVLMSGALPMDVLENKIDDWIAVVKR
jgi:uncharacterized protein (DUF885 family)